MHRICRSVLLIVVAIATSSSAYASLNITATELDDDVVFNSSGSINLSALSFTTAAPVGDAGINPTVGAIIFTGGPADIYGANELTGPDDFGPGETPFLFQDADTSSGDLFGFTRSRSLFALPPGYLSDSALSGTFVFQSATFESLGVTPGTYVWTFGDGVNQDTLTLSVIPEPTTIVVFASVGAISVMRRRQRTA